MRIPFTKLHGLGNDYVFVWEPDAQIADVGALAREMSDRHRGVGADGLILLAPPRRADADLAMRIFNSDGSRGQMCGNGLRCAGKLAYERGWVRRRTLRVEVDGRVVGVELEIDAAERCAAACVDMGPPALAPREIPVALDGERVVDAPLELDGRRLEMTCVSMGNPHAVFYVERVDELEIERVGPRIEHLPLFPARVNVHFAQVLDAAAVRVVTWERGAGRTQACGSGACAVCVAGVLTGRSGRRIRAELPGGALEVWWDDATGHVFQRGPAEESFRGEWSREAR